MERLCFEDLVKWKQSKKHKPLILRGARQVGKTWIVRELGKAFEEFIECNFEENPKLNTIFSGKLSPDHIVSQLENYLNCRIVPGHTLVFFDEIQLCPNAIVSLRYFYEKMPELHVIGAGSLIEFELENISFPVGRVEYKYIRPINFKEFLLSMGNSKWIELILNHSMHKDFPEPIHSELLNYFRIYSLIGGMPEAVQTYLESGNINDCQSVLNALITTFKSDFKKYAKKHQIKYLDLLFQQSPFQQGNKFKYSNISSEIKSRELMPALDLLCQADLAAKIKHSDGNGIPLGAESKEKKFKLILLDIGVSNRLTGLDYKKQILNDDFHLVNKGQLTEISIGQELQGYCSFHQKQDLYYWQREGSSNAEVDYVVEFNSQIVPVEVKHAATGRLRSIYSFLERKKGSSYGIKISKANFGFYNKIQSIPFYAVMKLFPNEY